METSHPDNDADNRLFRLLDAMASEISVWGKEIFHLGDRLIEAIATGGQNDRIREMQHFDVIGQGVLANAGLLKELARRMAAKHTLTNDDIDTLVDSIPFHAIRERLSAALDNRAVDVETIGAETSELFGGVE